jgi:hypothetical protein
MLWQSMQVNGVMLGRNPRFNANALQSSGVYAIYGAVWIYIEESNDIQRKLIQHWDGDPV